MGFDPNLFDKFTAGGRARAREADREREIGDLQKYRGLANPKGAMRWLGWLFVAAVLVGLAVWLVVAISG